MEIIPALSKASDVAIELLIETLNSLQDGERAENMLIATGQRTVPYLQDFLLHSSPRTIAVPRCRAVHALGELGAYSALTAYFDQYQPLKDAAVLLAEDAVRSAVARELMQWQSEATFAVLLKAAEHRATSGLILAVGQYCRPESIPLLFRSLEDDLCREDAINALRKIPNAARSYALRSISRLMDGQTRGGSAQWRCRAILKLLLEFGVSSHDWQDLRPFLLDHDANIVLSTAQIGLQIVSPDEYPEIMRRLIAVADSFNWLEEQDATTLLLSHDSVAHELAKEITRERQCGGEHPEWEMPSWRILQHLVDRNVKEQHHGFE